MEKKSIRNFLSLELNTKKAQFIFYTLLFFVTSFFSFIQFKIQNKEFMIRYDSITEYLTVLAYWGAALRHFFYNLFINHKFIIPQWDWTIGLGADILTTFNWYVIGDPLNLLSIFFSQQKTYYLYNVLIFIRLYLCGITYILYCNYKKINYFNSAAGAIAYIFCGWIFFCGIRHPYFITPLIYLPLLYLGIEKIFADESPVIFIVSVFLSCITNFYFFYVSTLLIFIYAVIKFFFLYNTKIFLHFTKYFCKTLVFYVAGLFLASFIFMPNVGSFLATSRADMKIPVPLLYEIKYYILVLFSLISPKMIFSYTFLGFSTIAFTAIIVSFTNKEKENRFMLIMFLLSIFLICIPAVGHVFNGFNYLTNRWCFAISFVQAMLISLNIDTIKKLSKKKIIFILAFSLCFSLGTIMICLISTKFKENFLYSYISLFISVVLIAPFVFLKKLSRFFNLALTFVLVMSLSVNGNIRYAKNGYNYLETFINRNELSNLLNDSTDRIIKDNFSNEHDFFRYEAVFKTLKNGAVWFGTTGDSFYWSENSEDIMSFLNKLAVTDSSNQSLRGAGNRTPLEALFGVKYLFLPEDTTSPEGFLKINKYKIKGRDVILYQNQNVLPFCFSYTDFISPEEFEELNFAERQSSLIKYALIDSATGQSGQTKINDVVKNNFTIIYDDKIIHNNESLDILKSGAKINVIFDKIEGAENYLSLKNFVYNVDHDDADIEISLNGSPFRVITLDPAYWLWNHNLLFNLSNYKLKQKDNVIEIVFSKKANYTLEDASVISYRTDNLASDISRRTENILCDISFSENKIEGKLTLNKDQFVCMQIPYSTGWRAYIDGKKADTYAAQIMYTGFYVPKGSHIIELYYSTPFFKVGCILSLFGLILFLIIIQLYKKGKI